MRVRAEDYDALDMPDDADPGLDPSFNFDFPECDFCDDRGCESCCPDDFAEMHLKWACDGDSTIQEAIEHLNEFIDDLREYENDGFELQEPVDNSHFWLALKNQSSRSSGGEETPGTA